MSLLGELDRAVAALQSTHRIVKVKHFDFSAASVNQAMLNVGSDTCED